MTDNTQPMKKQKLSSRMKKRALFYALMVTPFLLHIAIFYWYINIETFVLAFQHYELVPNQPLSVKFAGLYNFKLAINWMFEDPIYIVNGLKFYAVKLVISYTLCLLFSYYLYKKLPWAPIFKYFLFVPHILSSLLLVILFQYVVNDYFIAVQIQWFGVEKEMAKGLLDETARSAGARFAVIIFYGIWHGFGTSVLVYSGTMESIDVSMVESAQLDGVNVIQEFILITMPMIWSTFVTFLITSLSGLFMDQFNLFTFYASSAPNDMQVIGYKMYTSTLNAELYTKPKIGNIRDKDLCYPGLSAAGLLITLFMTPIVLFIRKVLIKWGPSAN